MKAVPGEKLDRSQNDLPATLFDQKLVLDRGWDFNQRIPPFQNLTD